MKPVIQKALVKLGRCALQGFRRTARAVGYGNSYVYPGPIQYFGPTKFATSPTKTLQLEQGK